MKTHFRYLFLFNVIVCLSFPVHAFNYYVTFTGSGASSTVDSVVVQNLYKSTQVTVPAGSLLRLYDYETTVNFLNQAYETASVYPNPIMDNATFTFFAKNEGKVQVSVYCADGKKVAGVEAELLKGVNSFQLSLPKGVFLIKAEGNGFLYTVKTISLATINYVPNISFNSFFPQTEPQKIQSPQVNFQYSPGDQLLYKGYSGNYCTIVTDKPTETKTTDFKFVDCTDTDGNHYAVVHIGTQTWMAENLKTTKYRNGEAIGTTTPANKDISGETEPKYQWAYNGDENNVLKFGRLYTWWSVLDSRNICPSDWHLASEDEWIVLENYLIYNGFNYDGSNMNNKVAKAVSATTIWFICSVPGAIGLDLTKNNSSGFTALPGGYLFDSGTFVALNGSGNFWSSTETSNKIFAWVHYLTFDNYHFGKYFINKNYGLSVRCIKD